MSFDETGKFVIAKSTKITVDTIITWVPIDKKGEDYYTSKTVTDIHYQQDLGELDSKVLKKIINAVNGE